MKSDLISIFQFQLPILNNKSKLSNSDTDSVIIMISYIKCKTMHKKKTLLSIDYFISDVNISSEHLSDSHGGKVGWHNL